MLDAIDHREITHPTQQPAGHTRCPPTAARDLRSTIRRQGRLQQAGTTGDDLTQLVQLIKIHPQMNAEPLAQRRRDQPGAGRRADQRKLRQRNSDRPGRGPFADDEIEFEILHRRVQNFFHRRVEPVNFVDEQNIAGLQVGQNRREVASLGNYRPRGRPKADPELTRHDLRQRRLSETGRPVQQGMVQRLATLARRLDENGQILSYRLLPDEIVESLRSQGKVAMVASIERWVHDAVHTLAHWLSS